MKSTAIALLLAAPAIAAPETRAPTGAERSSFDAYYQQRFPGAHAAPLFSISRDDPRQSWRIGATVDSAPRRGLRALCRFDRLDFSFAGHWNAPARARPYAWLEQAGCAHTALAVELLQQMPDVDLVALLERQAALLHSARILLGGNTACASQRAFRFALTAITVGSAGPNPEVLAGLVFKSDHDTLATVWTRRSNLDYNAWNVSCP
jgi:hypothetical protein